MGPAISAPPLYFATSSGKKYDIYLELLASAMIPLSWSRVEPFDHNEIDLAKLADKKLNKFLKKSGQLPCFVEQSGLLIPSWNDLPGGLSGLLLSRLREELICGMVTVSDADKRQARVETIIYFRPTVGQKLIHICAQLRGTIAREPRGRANYGWDSIFVPDGYDKTLAELGEEQRNSEDLNPAAAEFRHTLEDPEQSERVSCEHQDSTKRVSYGAGSTVLRHCILIDQRRGPTILGNVTSGRDFVGRDQKMAH